MRRNLGTMVVLALAGLMGPLPSVPVREKDDRNPDTATVMEYEAKARRLRKQMKRSKLSVRKRAEFLRDNGIELTDKEAAWLK